MFGWLLVMGIQQSRSGKTVTATPGRKTLTAKESKKELRPATKQQPQQRAIQKPYLC